MKYNKEISIPEYLADMNHRSTKVSIDGDFKIKVFGYYHNNSIHTFDFQNIQHDEDRILSILDWYQKWCWTHGHYQQWLPPTSLEELGKLWCRIAYTSVDSEVHEALRRGSERFERLAEVWVPPLYSTPRTDDYARIYIHPEEPRFCALRKSSLWKNIEDKLKYASIPELGIFLQRLIRDGVEYTLRNTPRIKEYDEDFTSSKGLKIKTGKILSIFYENEDNSLDNIKEILAGYVTDILRERKATIEDVEVCDDPSCIYQLQHHDSIVSCMKELNGNIFELYDALPGCRIAYIEDEDEIVQGRALIWDDVVGFKETTKIMDTIYARDSDIVAILKKWAVENGYWYKTSQSHSCRKFTNGKDEATIPQTAHVRFEQGVTITRAMFDEVPFVDTFRRYNPGGSFLTVGIGRFELSSTEGLGGYMTEIITCCKCDEILNEEIPWEDDNGNHYCESCREKHFIKCDRCGDWVKLGEHLYIEDTSETFCEECYHKRYFWCSHCDTDHPIEEGFAVKISENGVYKYMTFCCKDEMDDLYPNRKLCPMCNHYTNEDLVEIDGKQMCSHCVMCHTTLCESCGERHLTKDMDYIYVMKSDGNTVRRTCVCSDCKDKGTGSVYKCHECSVWHNRNIDPSVNLGYEQICPKCYRNRLNEDEKAA